MDKKHLVIICSRFPYPLDKGDKLRMFYQLKELSCVFKTTLIALSDYQIPDKDRSKLKAYCDAVYVFEIKKWKSILSVFLNLFNRSLPAQVVYFYNKGIHKKIEKLIIELRPDHIYAQLNRTSKYVANINIPKTLDIMDAFSYGAKKRAENSSFLNKWFWNFEAEKIKKFEKKISSNFDNLTIISNQDRSRISYLNKDITCVNNGISEEFLNYNYKGKEIYDIVFVGNLSYYPNIKAVEYIADRIVVKYKEVYNEKIKVNIVGPNKEQIEKYKNEYFNVTGWVDDVREAYCEAKIFVAPIFEGMGQQNKILEAIALNVPCICTANVAEALKLTNKEDVLVAHNEKEFCDLINTLLTNSNVKNEIKENAKNFITHNYGWKKVTLPLIDLLNRK